jgi:hypothetical protein
MRHPTQRQLDSVDIDIADKLPRSLCNLKPSDFVCPIYASPNQNIGSNPGRVYWKNENGLSCVDDRDQEHYSGTVYRRDTKPAGICHWCHCPFHSLPIRNFHISFLPQSTRRPTMPRAMLKDHLCAARQGENQDTPGNRTEDLRSDFNVLSNAIEYFQY